MKVPNFRKGQLLTSKEQAIENKASQRVKGKENAQYTLIKETERILMEIKKLRKENER